MAEVRVSPGEVGRGRLGVRSLSIGLKIPAGSGDSSMTSNGADRPYVWILWELRGRLKSLSNLSHLGRAILRGTRDWFSG